MRIGHIATVTAVACAVLLAVAPAAEAKKKRRGRGLFSGHGVKEGQLRTEPVPPPSGDVWVYSENVHEEVRVNIYAKNSTAEQPVFDDQALAQLDRVFRCKRTDEVRAVDPRLYQTLSVIFDHFKGKRVEIVSGFRFQKDEGSRHFHASAMDIRIEGISNRELYQFAESLDTGGMGIGIYPRAQFVHVDWRAPGEPSYRWTDRSGTRNGGGKRPSRRWKKPTS